MRYTPANISLPPGTSPEVSELIAFLRTELDIIARAFREQDEVQLKELHNEPAKLRAGMVVFADGTDWNPGSGVGVYVYTGSAWSKL